MLSPRRSPGPVVLGSRQQNRGLQPRAAQCPTRQLPLRRRVNGWSPRTTALSPAAAQGGATLDDNPPARAPQAHDATTKSPGRMEVTAPSRLQLPEGERVCPLTRPMVWRMLRGMRILAAIDFSYASHEALSQAKAEVLRSQGSLALCHVLPVMHEMSTFFPQEHQGAILRLSGAESDLWQAVRDRMVSLLGEDPGELFIEHGYPYAELIRRADAWRADLIVIGTHGKTGIEHVILGSAAERVARHANCSVLVARPAPKQGVVLAATDLSDPSLPAIRAAAEQAQRRGARLVVLTVVDWSGAGLLAAAGAPFGLSPAFPSSELQNESHSLLLDSLKQAIQGFGATGEPRVMMGSPASSILECAGELEPELLVVGTHGRTGLARLALGSVAEEVIQKAPCSVLAVRLHDADA